MDYLYKFPLFDSNDSIRAFNYLNNEEDSPELKQKDLYDFYRFTEDKNSNNFINAVLEVRKYEKSQEKLIIIAGACQSNYEELIKAGANFASSPKRINIHALDPAIVASLIALSNKSESIDLLKIINSTKYKEEGIGGIITNGTMYVGYPR